MHETLDDLQVQRASIPMQIHVPLQVVLAVLQPSRGIWISVELGSRKIEASANTHLEDEDQLGFGMYHIMQPDNVRVLQL